jgi:predicted Ser/Thr protein kinase/DNA-directed RNA polymerase subunit RPC12/RpoP
MQITCYECGKDFDVDLETSEIKCPGCGKLLDRAKLKTLKLETDILKLSPPETGGQRPAHLGEIKPGSYLGQYRILEEIGRGGMGVVYKALQTTLDRVVAIKVLAPAFSTDPEFVKRFEKEAKALAKLNHPNIVGIYDAGKQNDIYYFVMEYVDGINLRNMLNARTLSKENALALIPPLCEALEYAHSEGVIHRDIKPENILIDKKGRVKITDFGLVKIVYGSRVSERLTQTNVVMGTLNYLAPESYEHPTKVDHRVDIYALGVIIYEMLTGAIPRGKFAPPSKKANINSGLDEIVLKALEQDPENRYQRASDIITDLQKITPKKVPYKAEIPRRLSNVLIAPSIRKSISSAKTGLILTILFLTGIFGWMEPMGGVAFWMALIFGAIALQSALRSFGQVARSGVWSGGFALFALILAVFLIIGAIVSRTQKYQSFPQELLLNYYLGAPVLIVIFLFFIFCIFDWLGRAPDQFVQLFSSEPNVNKYAWLICTTAILIAGICVWIGMSELKFALGFTSPEWLMPLLCVLILTLGPGLYFYNNIEIREKGLVKIEVLAKHIEGERNEIKDVSKNDTVSVSAGSNDVTITGIEENVISVTPQTCDVSRQGNNIRVKAPKGAKDMFLRIPKWLSLSVSAASGDILIQNICSDLRVNTANGDIDIDTLSTASVDINCVNGDIRINGFTLKEGKGMINTVNGDVEISGIVDSSFRYNLYSIAGRIKVVSNEGVFTGRGAMDGKIGKGDGSILIKTTSGDIWLMQRT